MLTARAATSPTVRNDAIDSTSPLRSTRDGRKGGRLHGPQLRDHILEELNSLFRRLGFTSRIVADGLTSAKEIDEMMSKLQRGEVTVKEAMAVDKA